MRMQKMQQILQMPQYLLDNTILGLYSDQSIANYLRCLFVREHAHDVFYLFGVAVTSE